MTELSGEQIRRVWLHRHHLDAEYGQGDILAAAGACGFQNTPPGAWETALFNRVPGCGLDEMTRLLEEERSLLQAWSFRGAPVVFPTGESGAFLSALVPEPGEPWIYTRGISLALDALQLPFQDLLSQLQEVLPRLDGETIRSKTALDQTLAAWMLPLLPEEKRDVWNQPSMYGSPDKQTVGGAVVSFLLRPCAFCGLVVFAAREGAVPAFTSYQSWTGASPASPADAGRLLARKFLRCYGPATAASLESWLGCSGRQARRLFAAVSDELEPVAVDGKKAFILSEDRHLFRDPPPPRRELLLLGGHDPYLDQRSRTLLLAERTFHRHVWKTVSNPGAIVRNGEIIGVWTGRQQGGDLEIKGTLWNAASVEKQALSDLGEAYAAFRGRRLTRMELEV